MLKRSNILFWLVFGVLFYNCLAVTRDFLMVAPQVWACYGCGCGGCTEVQYAQ